MIYVGSQSARTVCVVKTSVRRIIFRSSNLLLPLKLFKIVRFELGLTDKMTIIVLNISFCLRNAFQTVYSVLYYYFRSKLQLMQRQID